MSYQELAMGVNSRQFNQELTKREKEDLHDLLDLTPKKKKRSLHYRGLECKVTSQELPGVTGRLTWSKNEAEKRLTEFCQENKLVIANTLFQ